MNDAVEVQRPVALNRARAWRVTAWIVCIVAVDQGTKSWVATALGDGLARDVIGTTVQFELTRNSGAAFSRFQGYTPVLAVLAVGIAVVLVRTLRRTTDRLTVIGLVMVLGGAVGNLGDRFFRSPGFLSGHVVDFVKVGSFPLFNVADSCVTIGAILIGARSLVSERLAKGGNTNVDMSAEANTANGRDVVGGSEGRKPSGSEPDVNA